MNRHLALAALIALIGCGQGNAPAEAERNNAPAPVREEIAPEQDQPSADPDADLLTIAEGAILVSASHDAAGALSLTDGSPATSWSMATRRNPPPYTFVFELRAPTVLSEVGVTGAGQRPGGVAGGSAKAVKIEASAEGAETGFAEIARLAAAPDGTTLAKVTAAAPVRWLRFTVEGNQSGADWTYFNEVVAHGQQPEIEDDARFTGVFKVGRADLVELNQSGASISGCYVENSGRSNGKITGAVVNGVALLTWTSDTDITGPALMTLDSTGALNGVRYRQRSRSAWGGPPAPDGTTTPCSAGAVTNPISQALQQDGEVRIYGILFNHDSDVPRSISNPALRQLLEALQQNAGMRVTIEGHTDSDGTDAYNLDLSARRAKAVVDWLVKEGIAADRLVPAGKGEAEPVANNDTADGKSLNRRVEVKVIK